MYDVALFETNVATLKNQSFDHLLDEDVRLLRKVYAVVCFIYMPIILIINALVMWSIVLYRGFQSNKNYWIFSFCVADYVMGGLCIPMQAFGHLPSTCGMVLSGKVLCLSRIATTVMVGVGSLYSLLFFTLDRFVEIAWPAMYKKVMTTRRTMLAIYIVWCHALVWALLPLAGWNRFDRSLWPLVLRCNFHVALPESYILITYIHIAVCVAVSVLAFASMIISIRWQITVFRKTVSYFSYDQFNFFLDRVDFVKIIFCIFVGYILTWTPFLVLVPFGYFRPISSKMEEITQMTIQLLSFTNSLTHVPIYIHFRREYKEVVKLLLRNNPSHWVKRLGRLYDESLQMRYSLDASTLEGTIFPRKDCLADAIRETIDDFRSEVKSYVYVGEESGMPTVIANKVTPMLTPLQRHARALDDSWLGTIVGRFTAQSSTIQSNLPKGEAKKEERDSTQKPPATLLPTPPPPQAAVSFAEGSRPLQLYVRTSLGTWV